MAARLTISVDVLTILPVSAIDGRYFAHFGQPND